jgi:hypothetical protein
MMQVYFSSERVRGTSAGPAPARSGGMPPQVAKSLPLAVTVQVSGLWKALNAA